MQRLEKELQRYQEEVATQAAKVEAMRAAEADEHDVKKQIEVLGEAEMMVPDSARRLQKAVEDLQEFMVGGSEDPSLLATYVGNVCLKVRRA